MFVPLTEKERQGYFTQNSTNFIPGYTGHCPTLRFHYGTGYGTKTKEILKELRDSNVFRQIARDPYRPNEQSNAVLKPIVKTKGQMRDYSLNMKYRAPRYIIGYTGFVPTLNFRYGKSYGRAADDSMSEFDENQRNVTVTQQNEAELFRSTARMVKPLRNHDEVNYAMRNYEEKPRLKVRNISASCPPIAGYTGHIPRIKDTLSQRYKTVVTNSLANMEAERRQNSQKYNDENNIQAIVEDSQQRNTAFKHV